MGEWSKKIGEYGENIVEQFLSIIGWCEPVKGITIPCSMLDGEHKNDKGGSVKTHGIDFLYSYINPLVDGQLNNIVISSKYSMDKYPNSPTQKFKWFMTDLINTMLCFGCSEKKVEIVGNYSCSSINDIGVLFWLNGAKDGSDDLISAVSSARIDIVCNNPVYIVDNRHVAFILDLMNYIKSQQNYNYTFYYPSTGLNINPITRKNTGAVMPVEYINSSLIPLKLENRINSNETILFIGTIENFEEDTFIRLMGLAKDLSTNLAGQVIIGFPDYNKLVHEESVRTAKLGFQDADYTKAIKVVNFLNSIDAL